MLLGFLIINFNLNFKAPNINLRNRKKKDKKPDGSNIPPEDIYNTREFSVDEEDDEVSVAEMRNNKLVLPNMVVGVFRVGTLDLYRITILSRAGLESGFSVDITFTKKDFDAFVDLLNKFRESDENE